MNRIVKKVCNREDLEVINENISTVVQLDGRAIRILGGKEVIPAEIAWKPSCQVSVELLEGPPDEVIEPSEECRKVIERLFVREVK